MLNDRVIITPASESRPPDLMTVRDRLVASGPIPFAIALRDLAGEETCVGQGEQLVEVIIRSKAGFRALVSLSELGIVEAYLDGDLDIAGDLVRAMELRTLLRDDRLALRAWSVLQPTPRARRREQPRNAATHYDSGNVQLLALDANYHTYSPGIYEADHEPLEPAAARKLETAHSALALAPGLPCWTSAADGEGSCATAASAALQRPGSASRAIKSRTRGACCMSVAFQRPPSTQTSVRSNRGGSSASVEIGSGPETGIGEGGEGKRALVVIPDNHESPDEAPG